jgi:hypothetical protein
MNKKDIIHTNLLFYIKKAPQHFIKMLALIRASSFAFGGQKCGELLGRFVRLHGGIVLFLLLSCHKAGEGGKASITATVKYEGQKVPFAQVYIKYDAVDFPGTDMGVYDDTHLANSDGTALFDTLYKGDYYLYAIGYDSTANENVFGGVYVEISKRKEERLVDIPVYTQ